VSGGAVFRVYLPCATAARADEPAAAVVESGTLRGFPNPPAMVRGEQSSPATHASEAASQPGVEQAESMGKD